MDFSFTNSFSVFGFSLIKGALIGFPTGLVLVILLGRFGLWRRKNRTHAILVKLYYLYIPLVFAAFFSGWFGISNIRDQADHTMAELRPTVTELSLSVADALLDDIQAGRNVKEISVKDVITDRKSVV